MILITHNTNIFVSELLLHAYDYALSLNHQKSTIKEKYIFLRLGEFFWSDHTYFHLQESIFIYSFWQHEFYIPLSTSMIPHG